MALTLHFHPLSSYCWKVLIALYETGASFEGRVVNLGDPGVRAAFVALWPTGKMPLLVDDGRVVPESSIIIEYLDRTDPGGLLPTDPEARLEARLWDRLFDTYVMGPMQALVSDHLRPEGSNDPLAVKAARSTLAMAYDMIESNLDGRAWAAGETFSLADCAAAPSLFYATTLVPFGSGHGRLAAYFERLIRRPSVARTIEEAKPYFQFYPLYDAIPPRFLAAAA